MSTLYPRPTEAQVEVLDLLIKGYTNKEIGNKLSLSEHTIKTHLRRAGMDVMSRNRSHLAVIYAMWKILRLDKWPKWDARRRDHVVSCTIFKGQSCDFTERRDLNENCRTPEGQ